MPVAAFRMKGKWKAIQRDADSKWEGELRDGVLKDCDYHTEPVPYTVEHKYHPDFVIGKYIIEAKGRFLESSEAAKYIWVRKTLPEDKELVFLFYSIKTRMPGAKKRRDGTYYTQVEWAEKNNFKWYTEETIKEIL